MKILVTGGTGFIGSNIVKKLLDDGHDVSITGNHNEQKPDNRISKFIIHDLDKQGTFKCPYVGGFDAIIHQAANNNTLDENSMLNANAYNPVKFMMEAFEKGCKKFIYASSTAVYGNSPAPYKESETTLSPLNPYANSKVVLERMMRSFCEPDVQVIGFRYCNVYGPGEDHKEKRMSMIGQLIDSSLKNKPLKIFKNGKQKRDWVHVNDVVEANVAALNSDLQGYEIFNIGSGSSISFDDLIKLISDEKPEYIDMPFDKSKYQLHTECDITKAKKMLSYNPMSICEGVKSYLEYKIAEAAL